VGHRRPTTIPRVARTDSQAIDGAIRRAVRRDGDTTVCAPYGTAPGDGSTGRASVHTGSKVMVASRRRPL